MAQLDLEKKKADMVKDIERFIAANTIQPATNNQEYLKLISVARDARSRAQTLENERKSITKSIDEAKTKVMNLFKVPITRLLQQKELADKYSKQYEKEQEAIRVQQERKLREITAKEQTKEVKKIEKQIEKLEKLGDVEGADMLKQEINTALVVPPVTVPSSVPKVEGKYTMKTWKWRLAEMPVTRSLSLIPREYLLPTLTEPDEVEWFLKNPKLKKIAKAMHDTLPIPGISFYAEETTVLRNVLDSQEGDYTDVDD